ncbi:MAG: GNAT family N-acetyltransferase [Ignavibacteria bacterium]|nr:GNAT family N-acetyltransferase [Ignavibacteria bacterium]
MIKLLRTDSGNPELSELIKLLDAVLRESDGDEHAFYSQYNKLENIQNFVIAYLNEIPAGCGAIKKNSYNTAEIKRMYVKPEFRGKGIAKNILKELEMWAYELNFSECILETGKKQSNALWLYKSAGYKVIPNYGQYAGVELSVCMKKILNSESLK